MKLKIKVLELSHNDIATIISGADGGINYWCQGFGLEKGVYPQYRKDNDYREDVQARALLDGKQMIFIDSDDDRDKYYLTYAKLVKGVEKWLTSGYGSSKHFGGEFDGYQDSEDMDIIIQFALFDKVIFG